MNSAELNAKRFEVEHFEEWRKHISEVPAIQFPAGWSVKIIPPFGGAMVRFTVQKAGVEDGKRISVYLDILDRLGYMEKPYWEIYPYEGDTARVSMADTKELVRLIDEELNRGVK